MTNNIEKSEGIKKRMKNLIPAKKGEPGRNPNGRPKGALSRSTIVKRWIESGKPDTNPLTGKKEYLTQADIMVLKMMEVAKEGNVQAFRELMDSAYGKITDKTEHTGIPSTVIYLPKKKGNIEPTEECQTAE